MRIAHVITRMIVGGAQENTLLNCEDLNRTYGDDVILITGPALGPEGDLFLQHPNSTVATRMIPNLRRAIHPWRDWRSYGAIKRLLAEFRPDVVHTHSAKGGVLGRMAAWSLRVPAIVHTVHGAPFHPYQNGIARWLFASCERYAARRCHALISVADAMTDLMVGAQVAPREKFTTIYSGMEIEPFLNADEFRAATRERFGFRPEHIVIGKIARLFHLKGHEFLIEAAAQLIAQHPQVRFLLVGDGILKADHERRIQSLGLADHFRFAGLVSPREIPSMIGAMDILVHVSLREGLARALPQALLAGKPVVSFDIDGAREVCLSERTGYLVPPRDVPGLTSALQALVTDPVRRQKFGAAGRQDCQAKFSHEKMTAQIRSLYERLLQSAKSATPNALSPSPRLN